MKLIYTRTGVLVRVNDPVTDLYGTTAYVAEGIGEPPTQPRSSGFIWVTDGGDFVSEVYPTSFRCRWVDDEYEAPLVLGDVTYIGDKPKWDSNVAIICNENVYRVEEFIDTEIVAEWQDEESDPFGAPSRIVLVDKVLDKYPRYNIAEIQVC